MSKQLFRAKIKYDTNCGYDDEMTLYVMENNSTDYRMIVDKEGNDPSVSGTDWYCNAVASVISLKSPDIERCTVEDLPEAVKIAFGLSKPLIDLSNLNVFKCEKCCFTCKNMFNLSSNTSKCRCESSDSNEHFCFYCCNEFKPAGEDVVNNRITKYVKNIFPESIQVDGKTYSFTQEWYDKLGMYCYSYSDEKHHSPCVDDGTYSYYLSSVFPKQEDAAIDLAGKLSRYLNHKNQTL